MIKFVGVTFNVREQFGTQEHRILEQIKKQIEQHWPNKNNLIINLTWFGPQFSNNNCWIQIQALITQQQKFDQIFWVCAVDPVCISNDTISEIQTALGSQKNYYIGVGFDSKYTFNTHACVIVDDFPKYTVEQLLLTVPKYLFINYNRKPKPHRIKLAEKLIKYNGIVTLGKNNVNYDVSEGVSTELHLTIDDKPENYTHNGKFNLHTNFGGIPYDLCSLGRLDLWQQHFLNVVSETVFFPWDTTFVTEKTWKPIVGMRPFIINGQTKIYQYLRSNGFKTFEKYFNDIKLENISEHEVHESIVDVIKYLSTLTNDNLRSLYYDMLPDLIHNRNRFFEYAREQQLFVNNLFKN